ncbi:MAG: alpha/beta hydrolase family protein, partial [Asticcacaulis sp.]
ADGKAQAFNLGKTEVSALLFADKDHVVVTTEGFDRGSNSRYRHSIASIYNLQDKSVTPLFFTLEGFTGEIVTNVTRVVRDGKVQLAAGGRKQDGDFVHFARFDLNGSGAIYDQSPIESRNFVLGPDGAVMAREIYYEHSRIYNLDYYQNGAWKTILAGKYEIDLPSIASLAADGRSIVITRRDGDGETRYYLIAPDGRLSAPFPFTQDEASLLADPITKRMNGHALRGDWPTYVYDDPVMADIAVKAQNAVPGYRMSIADHAANDPHKVIIRSEGDDDAGTYYFIDFASGANVTVGSEYPDINPAWLSSKKAISYKANDGLEIPAFLTLPPNRTAKNLPLVVIAHDGPGSRVGIGLDSDVETYAAMGYAVLEPNYRGAFGYGARFREAAYGEFNRKTMTDLSDGVAWLAAQGTVDPKRVAIVGYGFGGSLALAAMAFQPGTYVCAAEFEGASDVHRFMDGLRYFDVSDTTLVYRQWARYVGDPARMDDISPIRAADKVKGPILILHNETTGDSPQSRNMASALKAAGKDVTLIVRDWGNTEAERIATATTVTAFLARNNPPA